MSRQSALTRTSSNVEERCATGTAPKGQQYRIPPHTQRLADCSLYSLDNSEAQETKHERWQEKNGDKPAQFA